MYKTIKHKILKSKTMIIDLCIAFSHTETRNVSGDCKDALVATTTKL